MAFAALIALLAGIGQLGLRRMQEINDTLSGITGGRSDKLQLARDALTLSNRNSRITMEIFLVQDRALTGILLAERSENTKKVSALVATIASRCESASEKQRLSAVEGTRKTYVDSYLRALHLLLDEGEHDAAVSVMVNETLPALFKYHAAWDEFVEFQKDQVGAAVKQSQVDYVRARRLGYSLIMLAVAGALVIAVWTTRTTAREIAARTDAQKEVSKLNINLEERVLRRTFELTDANKHLDLQGAVLEAAANAIVITDCDGTIQWVNRAFTTMTGYSKEEVLGKNPRLLKSGDQSQSYYDKLWSTISSGKVWEGEIINKRKDGTTYTEEMTITPVIQRSGDTTHTCFIAIKHDITERKRTQDALVESERRYRSLFENMLEGFAYCEMLFDNLGRPIDFVYLAVNNRFGKLTGLQNVVGRRFTEVIPQGKDAQPELFERYSRVVRTAEPERFEIEIKALGMWFSISAYGAGNGCFVATFDNITERKQAEESLLFKTALLEAQAETTIDGILVVDESDHIVLANKKFGAQFGIPDEVLSTGDDQIVLQHVMAKTDAPDAFIERVKYLNSHRDEKSRDELRFKDGKIYDRYSAPLVDSKRLYRGRIWYFRDITERKVAEERIQFLAYSDALTALPNRRLLKDRLTQALASARRQESKVALLFLDLDRFKNINDSLGHAVGDLLLQEFAGRLTTWGREQDTVARVGGDEFLIVLTGLKDITDVAVAAERLMDALSGEYSIQGHALNITCSLGISIFPEHGTDTETLIKNADAAMYSAKESGRNGFRFFTADVDDQAAERLTLENSLQLVLEKKELSLVYQPQMDIVSGKIIGLEALLRWQHPKLGLVPPDKFIRIAENCGLIVPIGEWVLRTACSQAQKWQEDGVPPVRVAVNVSAVQFRRRGFSERIRKVLQETGLAPQYLELELTESVLLADADVTFSVSQKLKAMGVALTIDDFGTGYSSFSYLKQFRVTRLKIDRSFIRDVAVNPDDAAITSAIISMAKSLHLKVIAEGVENEAQMSFLRAHRCDEIQGYYFSKPLAVDKVADKLRGDNPEPHARAQASGKQS